MRARARTRVRVYTRLRSRACAREIGKLIQHILHGLHELRSVLDELMTTDREWILDTSRDAKHLASLLQRHARGDQRAAALRRLNHYHAEAEAADDPIAHREATRYGQRPVLGLGNHRAGRRNRQRQLGMFRGIDPVEPGRHHGNGWTLPFQCPAVRRRIDPTGQPADDNDPGIREIARQAVGGAPAVRRRTPRTDDGDHRLGWQPPVDIEARRRVMNLLEAPRVSGILEPEDVHPLSRYCSASATCASSMAARPSRSAMVRATRWTRWTARPLSCSLSAAASNNAWPWASRGASRRSWGPVSAPFHGPCGRRSLWRPRAAITRSRTSALDSAKTAVRSSSPAGCRGTSTCRSIRSRIGPDSRARYRCRSIGVHSQSRRGSPAKPQGQGFDAAIRMKRAGSTACPRERATASRPSSSGCRSASSASRRNSVISSMNKTPRCARVTSPGRGTAPPPPTSAAGEMPWCGARKGGTSSRPAPAGSIPTQEAIEVTSTASRWLSGGKIPGSALASSVLPVPGGPTNKR